jgi:hypothetical protein
LSPDATLRVDGVVVPLRRPLRMENPWTTLPLGSPDLRIHDDAGGLELDLRTGARRHW